MKSYGVTIQIKPLQQYFHYALFLFNYFTTGNLGFVSSTLGSKRNKEKLLNGRWGGGGAAF